MSNNKTLAVIENYTETTVAEVPNGKVIREGQKVIIKSQKWREEYTGRVKMVGRFSPEEVRFIMAAALEQEPIDVIEGIVQEVRWNA